ncbi:hypothetical protein [Aliihoeflea sp. 2WW]|uniref:hypothetical protein n=1 Tax=Aliihoeflea sp. 2WW TaxID=1381123 RepID=UPI0004673058|nr:hypothetical protein [Aliihoeflea sp. 2WW]
MSEALEETPHKGEMRRLAAAIREVKTNNADRTDVVVDLREAQQTRLEILAQDLEQVFADIPSDDERFDLNVTAGLQPRLWIDAVSHVTMGRDKRTYRFLKDTRNGRIVLAETPDIKKAANAVTLYVAERMVEREAVLAGDREAPAPVLGVLDREPAKAAFDVFTSLALFLAGAFVGIAAVLYFAWDRLAISF